MKSVNRVVKTMCPFLTSELYIHYYLPPPPPQTTKKTTKKQTPKQTLTLGLVLSQANKFKYGNYGISLFCMCKKRWQDVSDFGRCQYSFTCHFGRHEKS